MTIYDDVSARILVLSEQVWEGKVKRPDIDRWLANFDQSSGIPEDERENALHLLGHFNHFGLTEIRVLLQSMYRDYIRYPIVQEIRNANNDTTEKSLIENAFTTELENTRFLGMGNPSESGCHLLYYFRQVNGLNKKLFVHPHELLNSPAHLPDLELGIPNLRRVIFIDDVLGSGQQSIQYSKQLLPTLQRAAANSGVSLEIIYCVLFAKPDGLRVARGDSSLFTEVRAVHELDSSEMAFSSDSRVYVDPPDGVTKNAGQQLARFYGHQLFPAHPLGYRDGQMLLGLHHNVPDNTLPIFWIEGASMQWSPIFKRYAKEL